MSNVTPEQKPTALDMLRELDCPVCDEIRPPDCPWCLRRAEVLSDADEPSAWQPVETAPKDGTKILLGWFPETAYEGASTMQSQEVAFWHSIHQQWCGRELLKSAGPFSPTHWQPLPKPPKSP